MRPCCCIKPQKDRLGLERDRRSNDDNDGSGACTIMASWAGKKVDKDQLPYEVVDGEKPTERRMQVAVGSRTLGCSWMT